MSRSTVIVAKPEHQDKIGNIAILKQNPELDAGLKSSAETDATEEGNASNTNADDEGFRFAVEMSTGDGHYNLRNRDAFLHPTRYNA